MANWADNEAPGYDADDLTSHVVPGALLHSGHDKHHGRHRDQPATRDAKPVIWLQKSEKLRAVDLALAVRSAGSAQCLWVSAPGVGCRGFAYLMLGYPRDSGFWLYQIGPSSFRMSDHPSDDAVILAGL
jgi:hypothetical protein